MLNSRPTSFHSNSVAETSLIDYHRLIISFFNPYDKKLLLKTIGHQNYKNFDISSFYMSQMRNLQKVLCIILTKTLMIPSQMFTVDKHASLKCQIKPASIHDKGTQQMQNDQSNVRNKYLTQPSMEKVLVYKKAKSLFNVLLGKARKQHFQKFASKETITNKEFLEYTQTISQHQKCPRKRSNPVRN